MSTITIITNNRPRPVIEAWELSPAERAEFDYLDWDNLDAWADSRQFVRYQGSLIDLNDMERGFGNANMPEPLKAWDNYRSDSFFSGIVVKWREDYEQVVVGRYFS